MLTRRETLLPAAEAPVTEVAWAGHLRTELVSGALANAVAARNPGPCLIFHSGRGRQLVDHQPGRLFLIRPAQDQAGEQDRSRKHIAFSHVTGEAQRPRQ